MKSNGSPLKIEADFAFSHNFDHQQKNKFDAAQSHGLADKKLAATHDFKATFSVTDAIQDYWAEDSKLFSEKWVGPELKLVSKDQGIGEILRVGFKPRVAYEISGGVEPLDGIALYLDSIGLGELGLDNLGMLFQLLERFPPVKSSIGGAGFVVNEVDIDEQLKPGLSLANLNLFIWEEENGPSQIRPAYQNISDVSRALVEHLVNQELDLISADRVRPARIDLSDRFFDLEVSNKWLALLTDGRYEFRRELLPTKGTRRAAVGYENLVADLATGHVGDFQNVGSGLAHLWHILNALADYSKNTLYIEQPELHIHPKVQGLLAQALNSAIVSSMKSQIIVETHSENLLLAIQKLIRSGEIDRDFVSIIYVEKLTRFSGEQTSDEETFNSMINIDLDKTGDLLDPFPESFASMRANYLFD